MTGSFPGTDRARVSLRWDDASMPASLISSKRNADFTTVMRAIPGDLQAPALQRREIVGRRVAIPTSTSSATTRASEGEIGPFNTAPLLDSSPVGRQIMTSSRIAVSKEPTAGPSLERTTQTQNAAADVIRRREARGLLQAKHDSELPIDQPARSDESVMRTAAEPAREIGSVPNSCSLGTGKRGAALGNGAFTKTGDTKQWRQRRCPLLTAKRRCLFTP